LVAGSISARQAHPGDAGWSTRVVWIAVVGLVALAGCGSSKPAYCTDRSNLENSIKGLTSLNVSSGITGLQSQLKKIQTDATALVSSAKGDFPSETSAIKSSVAALESAVKAVPSSPSAGQIATVAAAGSNVVSSVKSFTDATSSKCG
jgi:hypothetical protein